MAKRISLPIDAHAYTLVSSGKVAEVNEWADGKIVGQLRDKDTGMPVWVLDCYVDDEEAARASVVGVRVASAQQPVVGKYQPVKFHGLTASIYVDKSGNLGTGFNAQGIEGAKAEKAA